MEKESSNIDYCSPNTNISARDQIDTCKQSEVIPKYLSHNLPYINIDRCQMIVDAWTFDTTTSLDTREI